MGRIELIDYPTDFRLFSGAKIWVTMEIVPKEPMPLEKFVELLKQVRLVPK